MFVFGSLIQRELRLQIRNQQHFLSLLFFGFLTLLVFAFVLPAEETPLIKLAPGFLWIIQLFCLLLSLDSFFKRDQESGMFAQFYIQKTSFLAIFLSKAIAHCLLLFCIDLFILPMLSFLFNVEQANLLVLMLSIAIGTPIMILLLHFGTCLTLASKTNPLFIFVLTLPFLVPCLIFTSGLTSHYEAGMSIRKDCLFLGALFLFSLGTLPGLAAYALKESVKE